MLEYITCKKLRSYRILYIYFVLEGYKSKLLDCSFEKVFSTLQNCFMQLWWVNIYLEKGRPMGVSCPYFFATLLCKNITLSIGTSKVSFYLFINVMLWNKGQLLFQWKFCKTKCIAHIFSVCHFNFVGTL